MREREGHYIMIKGLIKGKHQKKTLPNVYLLNEGAPKYIRKLLSTLYTEFRKNILVVEDFTPFSPMGRLGRNFFLKKFFKKKLDSVGLIDIYWYCLKNSEYMFFSSAHGTFSRTDQILGHKAIINKVMG